MLAHCRRLVLTEFLMTILSREHIDEWLVFTICFWGENLPESFAGSVLNVDIRHHNQLIIKHLFSTTSILWLVRYSAWNR